MPMYSLYILLYNSQYIPDRNIVLYFTMYLPDRNIVIYFTMYLVWVLYLFNTCINKSWYIYIYICFVLV